MAPELKADARRAFEEYLFTKGYLVNWDGEQREDCVRALYALADVFGIKPVSNRHLALWSMVHTAKRVVGISVPTPFYCGFPQSVVKLSEDEMIVDRLIHYAVTYGLGDFSQPGHSLLEEEFERLAFREKTEIREMEIVDADGALALMKTYVNGLLASTRALNRDMETLVVLYARLFPDDITGCNCKDTVIRLLCETKDVRLARFLQLPDVIRLADEINWRGDLVSPAIVKEEKRRRKLSEEYRRKYAEYRGYLRAKLEYERALSAYESERKAYDEEMNRRREEEEKRKASLKGRLEARFFSPKEAPVPPPPAPPVPPQEVPRPAVPDFLGDSSPALRSKKMRERSKNVRSLNLRNRDRRLISAVIDFFFEQERPNVRDCYEKRRLWAGLLHHIHYAPKNERAEAFVQAMRGKGENKSVYAGFEAAMARGDVRKAADVLARGKGGGAVGRSLNYLLSRCRSEEDVRAVVSRLDGLNLILLIQMIQQYEHYHPDQRTFRFVQRHLLVWHKETEEEAAARKSVLSGPVRAVLEAHLLKMLKQALAEKSIGRVYIEDGMERIAPPLQESAGSSGLGALPRGSRIAIGEGNKLRCFTYWERVDDIDLACFGLEETGTEQTEFSWRDIWDMSDEAIVFSGDETSGYHGGSEYMDISIPQFRAAYPRLRYLVFTANVYTGVPFDDVTCTAGFMIREEKDSGEVFEPKTVKSSFRITGQSTFAMLFALDLEQREIIWLNLCLNSEDPVAGETDIVLARDYLDATGTINLAMLFRGMATEVTDSPEDADVIVADHCAATLREGQTLIRSCDTEKILAYLNEPPRSKA